MIQRIQSIYLFLAAALTGSQFGVPYAKTADGAAVANTLPALSDGVLNPADNIGLLGLTGLGIIVTLFAIFLYKNRPLQARITMGSVLVTILSLLLTVLMVKQTLDAAGQSAIQLNAGLLFPVLTLVFQWLALRGIKKDDNLVRSMDRLR
jgi:glucan phosphoethanolaminetransferase (alkaline phosphatase superfamily)